MNTKKGWMSGIFQPAAGDPSPPNQYRHRCRALEGALLETILALEALASHHGLSLTQNGGPAIEKAIAAAAKGRKLLSPDDP